MEIVSKIWPIFKTAKCEDRKVSQVQFVLSRVYIIDSQLLSSMLNAGVRVTFAVRASLFIVSTLPVEKQSLVSKCLSNVL